MNSLNLGMFGTCGRGILASDVRRLQEDGILHDDRQAIRVPVSLSGEEQIPESERYFGERTLEIGFMTCDRSRE